MKNIATLIVITMTMLLPLQALAQSSADEQTRKNEENYRVLRNELERSKALSQQMETEATLHQLEMDNLRLQTEQLRMLNESDEAAKREQENADKLEELDFEKAEASKKAEEAAESIQDDINRGKVTNRNNIYLGVLIFSIAGFVWHILSKYKNEGLMLEHQKYGIVIVICSFLVMIFSFMISEGWAYQVDFLANLMSALRIKFIEDGASYWIDFQTKYAVLVCLCSSAYGLTTYLGITPVPKIRFEWLNDGNG
jgi:hypothetical protein